MGSVCYANTTYNNFSPRKCQEIMGIWGGGIERFFFSFLFKSVGRRRIFSRGVEKEFREGVTD